MHENGYGRRVVFLIALLVGCSAERTVESSIVGRIAACRAQQPCVVSLRDMAPFEWDVCYAFNPATTRADREAAMGTSDPGFREFEPQLVFLKNGSVVHEESRATNVEHPVRGEVVFALGDDANFRRYDRSATFSVSEQHGPEGPLGVSWLARAQ